MTSAAADGNGIENDPRHAIFKAYDIRGVYGEILDNDMGRLIGEATAKFLNAKSLVVSRDMRASSEPLSHAVIEGVLRAGCDVLDAGMISTDANYFAIANYGCDGGIQVTASHNPSEYNGLKISREKALPMSYESGLADVERLALQGEMAPAERRGQVNQRDVVSDWVGHVLSLADEIKPLKVVIDAANGMAGKMLPPLLEELPIEARQMYFELDGTFPNHEANPLKLENLRDLQKAVKEEGADLGVAFDGDADRCVLVDDRGEPVSSDLVTALLATYLLPKSEDSEAVVYDIRSSRVVKEEIEKQGGKPVRGRVGHSFMKALMREHNALFGGELSGHFYWRDYFFADSGVVAMINVLNLLSAEGRPLTELLKPIHRYSATGEINFDVEDKAAKIEEVAEAFNDGEQNRLDGLTVEYEKWWFNLRPSNTEPKLRLNLEAETPDLMKEMKSRVVEAIER